MQLTVLDLCHFVSSFSNTRVPERLGASLRPKALSTVSAARPLVAYFQDLNEVGLQLEGLSDYAGMRAPAGMYEFGAEDFRFDVERDDVDLFPAPDIHQRTSRIARKPLKLPEFGNALTACKGWWTEEFTFRGFGIGFVKPVFRGLLLRPDFGLGVRLPVTLHFRSWESREALPAVALSVFVLWPPAVQVSQAMSYPAELLQEWATTAARKIAVPSKEVIQVRSSPPLFATPCRLYCGKLCDGRWSLRLVVGYFVPAIYLKLGHTAVSFSSYRFPCGSLCSVVRSRAVGKRSPVSKLNAEPKTTCGCENSILTYLRSHAIFTLTGTTPEGSRAEVRGQHWGAVLCTVWVSVVAGSVFLPASRGSCLVDPLSVNDDDASFQLGSDAEVSLCSCDSDVSGGWCHSFGTWIAVSRARSQHLCMAERKIRRLACECPEAFKLHP